MTNSLRRLLILGLVALIVGVPVRYAMVQYRHARNFGVVEEGVLYRSAQLDIPGLARVIHDHQIKSVISIRDGQSKAEQNEETYCNTKGIRFFRIKSLDLSGESDETVTEFRRIMSDPKNLPALIHCFAGIHRTGQYCAVYRLDHGWNKEDTIREMIGRGYTIYDQHGDAKRYFESYVPKPSAYSNPFTLTAGKGDNRP